MELVKFIVFVPKTHEENIIKVLGESCAGKLGNYDYCSFSTSGFGRFRPLKGSNPHIGEQDKIEKVEELKIEAVCQKKDMKQILKKVKEAHPYEEMAFDIIPLINHEFEE